MQRGATVLHVAHNLSRPAFGRRTIECQSFWRSTSKSQVQTTKANHSFSKSKTVPWLLSSILAGGIAFYGGQLYVAAKQPCSNPAIADLQAQKDVSERYEYTADAFDSEVGLSEVLMGINRMRNRLVRKAQGHVLEVSCGTGRNLGYYDIGKNGQVESLTFVDLSPPMVDVCRKKWDSLYGSGKDKLRPGLVVRFLPGSALEQMPFAPGEMKYSTVVQTMGLCSTDSPVALLDNMARYLDTSNPDARILLLEHGRSYQPWLNRILDNSAEKHAEIHGCWFNRDIGALVEEAAEKTGLEVVSERRYHLGTTWMFELKPKAKDPKMPAPASQGTLVPEKDSRSWFN